MSVVKLSQLPAAAPLSGTELMPLVQSGVTSNSPASGLRSLSAVNSISATLASGSTDLGASPPAGYAAGTTNRLILTPNAAGSTLLGLLAAGDGFQLLIYNASTTAQITFAHQSAGNSANQFTCPLGVSYVVQPFADQLIKYIAGVGWVL